MSWPLTCRPLTSPKALCGRHRYSRNLTLVQVATDTRLWLHGQLHLIRIALIELLRVASSRAEAEVDVIMPGQYTSIFFITFNFNHSGVFWG